MSNDKRRPVSLSMHESLVAKLDEYAASTRRNRSAAVETLVFEHSVNKAFEIKRQAQKIAELEDELILLKATKGPGEKSNGDHSKEDNIKIESLLKSIEDLERRHESDREFILELKTKLTNLNDSIGGLYKQSQIKVGL